jgi:cytochrome c peroxidase
MKMKTMTLIFGAGLLIAALFFVSCADEFLQENPDAFNDRDVTLLMASDGEAYELTLKEQLGKELYFDNISSPATMSCADCHASRSGFSGPVAGINLHGAVYPGAAPNVFGNRRPPTAAYATFSPVFHYDDEEGLFIGGNFWDGRATGETLGSPAAEQALGPFLNPVEHNLPDAKTVLEMIADEKYIWLWEKVWGEPLMYETDEQISMNYDRVGLSIAAFEASEEVNQFSSKYDYYLQGRVELTEQEQWGLELFNGKGQCALCHPSQTTNGEPPLFTDFTFDNLGTPKNPENPVYDEDPGFIDPGLGGFLMTREEYEYLAYDNWGKHKVPTLRNVGKGPDDQFPKAYMHNGVFKSLKEVVHFYNTRDVEEWPDPEVAKNVNTDELGDLKLTDAEEDAIVAFMNTLSDGYKLKEK